MRKFLIFSILVITLLTLINILHFRRGSNDSSNELNSALTKSEISFERFITQWREAVDNENRLLNNSLLYYGSDTTELINFSEIVVKNHLVFSFSRDMCSPCITFAIDKLKEHFQSDFDSPKVIIVCEGLEERLKDNYMGKPVWSNYKDHPLPIITRMPSFYIVDQDMMTKCFFTPDFIVPELTDIYLYSIKERFFPN